MRGNSYWWLFTGYKGNDFAVLASPFPFTAPRNGANRIVSASLTEDRREQSATRRQKYRAAGPLVQYLKRVLGLKAKVTSDEERGRSVRAL